MPTHPLRTQHEDEIYFVHNMCLQEQYMLLPKPTIINEFLVALICTLAAHTVELYGYVVLVNRFYLMLSSKELELPRFMLQFQSRAARLINQIHGRHSPGANQLVCDRYKKADIRGILAGDERLSAMMCAMVEEGFCPFPGQWGDASSYEAIINNGLIGPVTVDQDTYDYLKECAKTNSKLIILPPSNGKYQVQYKLSKLPWLAHLSDAKYAQYINQDVQQRAANFRRMRNHQFQNPQVFLNHPWDWKPPSPQEREIGHDARGQRFRDPVAPPTSRGGRGRRKDRLVYALPRARAQYWKDYQALCHEYADAMEAYVKNYDTTQFPLRTCRPGLIECEKPTVQPGASPPPPPPTPPSRPSWPGPVWPQLVLRVLRGLAAGAGSPQAIGNPAGNSPGAGLPSGPSTGGNLPGNGGGAGNTPGGPPPGNPGPKSRSSGDGMP